MENGVTDIVALNFDTLKIAFFLSNDVAELSIKILGQPRITAYIQMSNCWHVHGIDDFYANFIFEMSIGKFQLVDKLGTIETVAYRLSMYLRNRHVASVQLVWCTFITVHHAKTFGYVPIVVHLLIVFDQMTCLFIFSVNQVELGDFVSIFVFFHCIDQSLFISGQMVLIVFIFVTILALTRVTLVHFRLIDPVVVWSLGFMHVEWGAYLGHHAMFGFLDSRVLFFLIDVQENYLLDIINEICDTLVLVLELGELLFQMWHRF